MAETFLISSSMYCFQIVIQHYSCKRLWNLAQRYILWIPQPWDKYHNASLYGTNGWQMNDWKIVCNIMLETCLKIWPFAYQLLMATAIVYNLKTLHDTSSYVHAHTPGTEIDRMPFDIELLKAAHPEKQLLILSKCLKNSISHNSITFNTNSSS